MAFPLLDETTDKNGKPAQKTNQIPNGLDTETPHGILRRANRYIKVFADSNDQNGTLQATHDLGGRHFSLWIRPESDWSARSTAVPICEARIPQANATGEIQISSDGTVDQDGKQESQGDNSLQNYLGLFYDVSKELLVLTIAPPTIEHARDSGPAIAWDDPATPDIDERCLGLGKEPLAPNTAGLLYFNNLTCLRTDKKADWLAPRSLPGFGNALKNSSKPSPLLSVTDLIKSNRIVYLFSTRKPNSSAKGGKGYFQKGRWSHIQVLLGDTRPGGSGLIVDGIAGRDVLFGLAQPNASGSGGSGSSGTKTPAANVTCEMKSFGDHCTLPALPLISKVDVVAPGSSGSSGSKGTPNGTNNTQAPTVISATSGKELTQDYPNIQVASLNVHGTTINAEDLFPSRGMIRIGDEYIAYKEIKGNTFTDCVRGQRQNSNTGFDGIYNKIKVVPEDECVKVRWPRIQAHEPGSLVVPGGYRLDCEAASWATTGFDTGLGSMFRGGCTLADILPNGDPNLKAPPDEPNLTVNPYAFRIWTALPKTAQGTVTQDPNNQQNLLLWANGTGNSIPLDKSQGVPEQFPPEGVVKTHGKFFYYNNGGPVLDELKNVTPMIGWNVKPFIRLPVIDVSGISYNPDTSVSQRIIFLVSLRVSGPSPADPGRYSQFISYTDANNSWGEDHSRKNMLQLLDPLTGRIEWIWYRTIVTGASSFFLTTDDGWHIHNRGMMRTDFTGRQTSSLTVGGTGGGLSGSTVTTHLAPATTFPAGTLAIPVQTSFAANGLGHFLATGDVITFMPKDIHPRNASGVTAAKSLIARQMVVRYAAMDGYTPLADKGQAMPGNDVINEYFALAHFLPSDFSLACNYEILCGNGWSCSKDLSYPGNGEHYFGVDTDANGNTTQREIHHDNAPLSHDDLLGSCPPRLDLFSDNIFSSTFKPFLAQDVNADPSGANNKCTATLTFAAVDPVRSANSPSKTPLPLPVDCTIDALAAGSLVQECARVDMRGTITHWLSADGATALPGITTELSQLPCLIEARDATEAEWKMMNGKFSYVQPNPLNAFHTDTGLIQIGGEVFAWLKGSYTDHAASNKARLVARGLLGSAMVAHNPDEPFQILPIGPVALLDGTLGPQQWVRLDNGKDYYQQQALGFREFDAPLALMCKPDGSQAEVLSLIGSKRVEVAPLTYRWDYTTADWCRGLYNTPDTISWTGKVNLTGSGGAGGSSGKGGGSGGAGAGGGSQLQPVIIGWWPRYPSAMKKTPTTTNPGALYRSRLYGWVGFPHAMHGAWYWPALFASLQDKTDQNVASVTLLDNNSSDVFEVMAMALASNQDWTNAAKKAVRLNTGVNDSNLNAIFQDADEFNRAAEGAELRVFWRYKKPPSVAVVAPTTPTGPGTTSQPSPLLQQLVDMAEAGGTSPALGPVKFRCLAPTKVLAVEGER